MSNSVKIMRGKYSRSRMRRSANFGKVSLNITISKRSQITQIIMELVTAMGVDIIITM